jgi:hypothetical protein
MRLKFCQPIAQLCNNGSSAAWPLGTMRQSGSINGSVYALQQWNTVYINPSRFGGNAVTSATNSFSGTGVLDSQFISLIACGFSRWRVIGPMKFHYEAQASAFEQVQFAMCFTSDPYHPTVGALAYRNASTFPIVSTIDSAAGSLFFPSWESVSMEVQGDSSWKYMYAVPSYGAGASVQDESRLNFCGALTCLVNYNSSVTDTAQRGRLFWEAEIEFMDPVPISLGTAFLNNIQRDALTGSTDIKDKWDRVRREFEVGPLDLLKDSESKEEVKEPPADRVMLINPDNDDGVEVVTAPRFRPTPSSVPGGSQYVSPPLTSEKKPSLKK